MKSTVRLPFPLEKKYLPSTKWRANYAREVLMIIVPEDRWHKTGFHPICPESEPDQQPRSAVISPVPVAKALSTKCLRRCRTHHRAQNPVCWAVWWRKNQSKIQYRCSNNARRDRHWLSESNTTLFAVLAIQSDLILSPNAPHLTGNTHVYITICLVPFLSPFCCKRCHGR